MRHFDRNEITIWASEKSSIMKKCKAAVSPFFSPGPSGPSSKGRGVWGVFLEHPKQGLKCRIMRGEVMKKVSAASCCRELGE